MKRLNSLILSTITAGLLIGCGGGSSSTTTSTNNTTSGIAVDPYIKGATFYYDANENDTYDSGEVLSTATDENGSFTFNSYIPDGGKVIMKDKGMHNGVPFDGQLSANLSSSGVVNPLTSLETKGFTPTEIVNLLANAGISITEADIHKDPMSRLNSSNTTATVDDLEKIQAAVAVNTFLKIVGTSATKAQINANTASLTKACNLIKLTITPELVSSANADTVLKVAVAVSDYLVNRTLVDSGDTTTLDAFIADTGNIRTNAITALTNSYENPVNVGKQYVLNADGTTSEVVQVATTYDNFDENNIGDNGEKLWLIPPFSVSNGYTWESGKVTLEAKATSSNTTLTSAIVSKAIDAKKVLVKMKMLSLESGNETRMSFSLNVKTNSTLNVGDSEYFSIDIYSDSIRSHFGRDNADGTEEIYQTNTDTANILPLGKTVNVTFEIEDGNANINFNVPGGNQIGSFNITKTGIDIEKITRIALDVKDANVIDNISSKCEYSSLFVE